MKTAILSIIVALVEMYIVLTYRTDIVILMYSAFITTTTFMFLFSDTYSKSLILNAIIIGNTISVMTLLIIALFVEPKKSTKIVLNKPKIIEKNICGVVDNKPQCYKLNNEPSAKLKYFVETSPKLIVHKIDFYTPFGSKFKTEYCLNEKCE